MKNFYTRFIAIVVIIMMALSCTVAAFADDGNPYQDSYYDIPSSGMVVSFEAPIMPTPSSEDVPLGKLEAGTMCRILGIYDNDGFLWYIVDLAIFDGFDAEYGFIGYMYMIENPSWIMLAKPTTIYSTAWFNDHLFYNGRSITGLVVVLDEDEEFYAVQYMNHFGGTSFLVKNHVKPYSQEGHDLYILPIGAPVYDDSRNQIGELPGLTVIDVDDRSAGNYIHITANPGTADELSCWIDFQSLQRIIN